MISCVCVCVYIYIFIADDELRDCTKGVVSISILTEDEAGGFFHNIVFIALFNLFVHVNLHVLFFN
jgi:hypothetical protein